MLVNVKKIYIYKKIRRIWRQNISEMMIMHYPRFTDKVPSTINCR